MNEAKAKQQATRAIDEASPALRALSLSIHSRPELNWEEHHAHGALTGYLATQGFAVTPSAFGIPTAFQAVAGSGGPTLAVFCEYDALPGIGHACGHNLIAIAGVAVGLALKAALPPGAGTVVVLGSPAEEGGHGKVYMAEKGALDGVDAAMMLHPSPTTSPWFNALAIHEVTVEYFGRNAHASASPWEGVNALDAMVTAYNAISVMRQQLRPTDRVHGVISEGGLRPNIIPDHTRAEFYVRAKDASSLDSLKERVVACFEAAAKATGCRVEITWAARGTTDMRTNDPIAEAYVANLRTMGIEPLSKQAALSIPGGSTDMGNVSQIVPSIHPMFAIPTKAANHTPGFTEAAATDEAHAAAVTSAKALALTAIELVQNPDLLSRAKRAFAGSGA